MKRYPRLESIHLDIIQFNSVLNVLRESSMSFIMSCLGGAQVLSGTKRLSQSASSPPVLKYSHFSFPSPY